MSPQTIIRRAQKPWTEYFPYTPDQMPPRGGDKAALKRVLMDTEIEKEDCYFLLKGVA